MDEFQLCNFSSFEFQLISGVNEINLFKNYCVVINAAVEIFERCLAIKALGGNWKCAIQQRSKDSNKHIFGNSRDLVVPFPEPFTEAQIGINVILPDCLYGGYQKNFSDPSEN